MVLVAKPKRSTTIHNKRRAGQHHKRNDHYTKTYWPYLPIALIVGIGIALNAFWGGAHKSVLGYATDMSVGALYSQTNGQRANNGLGALALNDKLNQAAQAKANDMAARDYWAHNTPDGQAPWVFFVNAGYNYQTAGENLAYGFDSSSTTVTAWMNSPEHRDNILNTTYKDIGFGVANAANYQGSGPETIVVAEYGSQQAAVPAAPAPVSKPASTGPAPSATPSPAAVPTTPASTPAAQSAAAPAQKEQNTVSATPVVANTSQAVGTKNVSRIQVLSGGNAPWSMFAVSIIAGVALVIFLLRHGLMWHRFLVRGEAFIIKHRMLDMLLVAVGVLGFVLTRSAGIIH